MSTPNWLAESERLVGALMAKKRTQASAMSFSRPIRDSFHTAPGWRDLGMEISCIPDVMYPWDPAVVKAIREFDSTLEPLWIKWAFLSPSDADNERVVVFGRHAIGRYKPVTTMDVPDMTYVARPSNTAKPAPNIIEKIWMDPNDKNDLPGAYRPFDWRLYQWCRSRYVDRKTIKELSRDIVDTERELQLEAQRKSDEELQYRQRDVDRFIRKKLENVSEVEMKEYALSLGRRSKAAKPFIHLGSTPTR